jgi:MFS family permease
MAGGFVDRWPRKQVFVGTSLIQATILLAVSSLGFATGAIPDFLIIVIFATTLLGYQIHYPNLYAFAQEITPPQHYARLTSQLEITGQCTSILSGALAALLLSGCSAEGIPTWLGQLCGFSPILRPWSLTEVFALDGLTYLVAAGLISRIRYVAQCPVRRETGSFGQRMTSCLAYLRQQPMLIVFGSFSNVVFVAVSVELHTLMPAYLLNHLKSGPLLTGAAQALFAVGALLAGILIRRLFASRSTQQAIIVLMSLAGASFAMVALGNSAFLFCAFCFLTGFANTGIRIFRMTYLLKKVPNYLMGRVNSVFTLTNTSMRTLFSLLFSQTYFTTGPHITVPFLIIGVYVGVSALIIMLVTNFFSVARDKQLAISGGQ